jgi:hypothetical protein
MIIKYYEYFFFHAQGDVHICTTLFEKQLEQKLRINETSLDIYGNKTNKDSRKRRITVNGSMSTYKPLLIEEKTKVSKVEKKSIT